MQYPSRSHTPTLLLDFLALYVSLSLSFLFCCPFWAHISYILYSFCSFDGFIKLWGCIGLFVAQIVAFVSAYIPYFTLILRDWYYFIKFLAFAAAFLAFDATGHNAKTVTSFFKNWGSSMSCISIHHSHQSATCTSSHLLAHLCQLTLPLAMHANGSRSLWTPVPLIYIYSISAYNPIALSFSTVKAPCATGLRGCHYSLESGSYFIDVLDRTCNNHGFYENLLDCERIKIYSIRQNTL